MLHLINLLVFLFGASLASGLLVCAQRLPAGQSILAPRSRCAHCHHPLTWWQLLPVLSYLCLKRRCYYCRKTIPAICFFVEISGGLLSLSLWVTAHTTSQLIYAGCMFSGLFLFSLIDIQYQVILPILFWPWLLLLASLKFPQLHYATAIAIGLAFAAFAHYSQGLGSGDVELLAGLALLANVAVIHYLLLACLLALAAFPIFRQRKMAFIPYLSLAVWWWEIGSKLWF